MAFIALPNGIKVAMELRLDGQLVVNVYHFTKTIAVVEADLLAIATLMTDWWDNDLYFNFSNNIALERVVATDVSVAAGGQYAITQGTPIPGNIGSPAASNNVACVVTKRTAKTGRAYRGRTYFAGFTEANIVNNTLDSSIIVSLITSYSQMIDDAASDGFTFVVASYQLNNAPRIVGAATPVTQIGMNARVDTQRRRLPDEGA